MSTNANSLANLPSEPSARLHPIRILLVETQYELARLLRTPAYPLAGIGIPVLWYLLFGTHGGKPVAFPLLASYACVGMLSACLLGIGHTLARGRSQGWLDLRRASPRPRFVFLGAKVVSYAAFGLIIASVLMALAGTPGGVIVTPALPRSHLAQIALAVVGLAPVSGVAPHCAVLSGIAVLLLVAAWITFPRSEANA